MFLQYYLINILKAKQSLLKKTLAGLTYLRVFIWKLSSRLGGIPANQVRSHLGGLPHFSYEHIYVFIRVS